MAVQIVAGGGGFIGVNLVKRLLDKGTQVAVLDNFSMQSKEDFLSFLGFMDVFIIDVDLSDQDATMEAFQTCNSQLGVVDAIWHLAANSDIPAGVEDTRVDVKHTFMPTVVLCDLAKRFNIEKFYFASSSAVYGDWGDTALVETLGPLAPISNYGAMKLASEAQICAAANAYLTEVCIFRFPNVIGVPATHGVIYDFVNKLKANKTMLQVLGDGSQKKSYLHVSELVDAMMYVAEHANSDSSRSSPLIINIGNADDGVSVRDIAEYVVSVFEPHATIEFGSSNIGWLGDVPKFRYVTEKLTDLGWYPRLNSEEAMQKAAVEIVSQLTQVSRANA